MSNEEVAAENKLAKQWERLVSPAELAVLFQGERRDVKYRTRDVVWSESLRQAKLAFVHENHGGCFPHDADGSFWLTGSDLV